MPRASLNTVDPAGHREDFCPQKELLERGAGIRLFKS